MFRSGSQSYIDVLGCRVFNWGRLAEAKLEYDYLLRFPGFLNDFKVKHAKYVAEWLL